MSTWTKDDSKGCACLIFWVGAIITATALWGWVGLGLSIAALGLVGIWEVSRSS